MTTRYESFLDGIRHRADLAETGDVRASTIHVLEVLSSRLDGVDRSQMAVALPPEVRDAVHWDAPHEPGARQDDLVGEIARRASCEPEHARALTRAVLAEMALAAPAVVDTLRHGLPAEVTPLFDRPGTVPEQTSTEPGAEGGARPLGEDELRRALTQLENWAGTTERLTREATLPTDRHQPVLTRVRAAEIELSHRAEVTENDDILVFSLTTRSVGGVSELDLQLARRIDEAVLEVATPT
ncbi:DUF2267 domain-containing protein [Allosaccharopolyspora coralli]|uniref:Putative pterin-4-alpha-carbinolamine dehydratase n=1 Tax=Allosaccharopolyspora coralli TaxID=2665642 RepID=A0A5Q3QIL0_9PSEU|nr:DUF2267 domain-containing protein [Allosaccharopolyspora coralli]QGK70687.1 DUF2267 domain-containing protein [Allosaccharopolyspora coralli]